MTINTTASFFLALLGLGSTAVLATGRAAAADAMPVPVVEVSNGGNWVDASQVLAWGDDFFGESYLPNGLGGAVAIAAGQGHSLALGGDGTVTAWGNNSFGETNVPAGLGGLTAIAAGCYDSLALKSDGTVAILGGMWFLGPPLDVPAGLSGVTAVTAGFGFNAALKSDGTVVAWGDNTYGQCTVPAGLTGVTAIAAGDYHMVALKSDGTVVAWGDNSQGQSTVPAGLTGVTAIAAGGRHSLALKGDGTVVAWGDNSKGEGAVPSGLSGVTAIAAGVEHCLALKGDVTMVGWGDNQYLESQPPAHPGIIVAIAAGGYHDLAISRRIALDLPPLGASVDQVVRFRNPSATASITGLRAAFTTTAQGIFTVLTPLPDTLAPGASAQTTVRYTPAMELNTSARLQVFTGASASPLQEYLVTATAVPLNLFVQYPYQFQGGLGAVTVGGSNTAIAYVENTGKTTVTNLTVTVDGANAADFTMGPLPFTSLPSGWSMSIPILFAPTVTGDRTAAFHIGSSDSTPDNVVSGTLWGFGSAMELSFAGTGGAVLSRSGGVTNIDLGNIQVGTPIERSFTLRNVGSTPLTGLNLSGSAYFSTDISVVQDLPVTLAAGASATFTLRFAANGIQFFGGEVSVGDSLREDTPQQMNFSGTPLGAWLSLLDGQGQPVSTNGENKGVIWSSGATSGGYTSGGYTPAGWTNVTAIARGDRDTVVLKDFGAVVDFQDSYYGSHPVNVGIGNADAVVVGGWQVFALRGGSLSTWGDNYQDAVKIPPGLSGVNAIAAGGTHVLALQGGMVVAFGDNTQGQTKVPARLGAVASVAAGYWHSVVLKTDGTVVAWGRNTEGQCAVPTGLNGVTAIAAAEYYTAALKADGTVVAWGLRSSGLGGPRDVVAISASNTALVALKNNGTAVALPAIGTWGDALPQGLGDVSAVVSGGGKFAAIAQVGGTFNASPLGTSRDHVLTLRSTGNEALTNISATIEGPDADVFSLPSGFPSAADSSAPRSFPLRFAPTRAGTLKATLKIYSSDPTSPFVLPLQGIGSFHAAATQAYVVGSTFTYGPLTLDRLTGLMVQTVRFTNTSTVALDGLRLALANVASGVQVYSSSLDDISGALDVLYTNPIPAGATVQFNLVYFDPLRRTVASLNPVITAEALVTPVSQPGPVDRPLIKLLGVRDTPEGPLLEWNTVRNSLYVVEYSDDKATTWHSAVHSLGNGGGRMLWVDRGQPETQTTPVNKAARMYRVKKTW